MKKMNNKGFSLVELIIVIAIMAVLMGVLAPQLLKYVEDSRVQSDLSAMGEVENATKIALAVEKVYNAAGTTETVTIADGNLVSATCTELEEELRKTIPEAVEFTSKTYDTTSQTIIIEFDAALGTFKLTNSWDAAAAGGATP